MQLAVTHKAPRSSVRRSQLIRVAFIRSSELRRHESKFGEQKAASKSLVSEVLARCWLVRVTLVRLRVRDVTLVATLVVSCVDVEVLHEIRAQCEKIFDVNLFFEGQFFFFPFK